MPWWYYVIAWVLAAPLIILVVGVGFYAWQVWHELDRM